MFVQYWLTLTHHPGLELVWSVCGWRAEEECCCQTRDQARGETRAVETCVATCDQGGGWGAWACTELRGCSEV